MKFNCRLEESTFNLEDSDYPNQLPTAEDSEAVLKEVDGPEKEAELGIFQIIERLEEVTNMLTNR